MWGSSFEKAILRRVCQVTLQDQQRETSLLAKRLGLAAKENQDLAEWVFLLLNQQGANTFQSFVCIRCATAEPDMKGKVVYEVDDPNRPRQGQPLFIFFKYKYIKNK